MRKFYKLFLLSVLSTLSICASAHDFEVDEIYYKITSASNQTVAVTFRGDSYTDFSDRYFGTVVIPEEVDYDGNTYRVTTIDEYAFYRCTQLTSVKIPSSITSIRTSAFSGCTGLKTVTMGNGVTSIQASTFEGCTTLSSITLSTNLTRIGARAFYDCTALSAIKIPGKVNSIGEDAFLCPIAFGHSKISKVEFESLAKMLDITYVNYASVPGVNSTDGTHLYFNGVEAKDIVIPSSVTHIGDYMFESFILNSVKIPSSVVSIGKYAFKGCTGLTSITIPNGVTSIGSSAFEDCKGLTSVTIGNSVETIGQSAFEGCKGLTSVTIGNSVETIGQSAFEGCKGLTSVTIPNSVTTIGYYAFYGCTGLTSVEIPNSVTSIERWAFGSTGLISVTIPSSVTSISDYAFYECTGLASVEVPNSVTTIGDAAFYNCTNLTNIKCLAQTPPTCWSSTFYYVDKSACVLEVPEGSATAYNAASYWKEFNNIQEIVLDKENMLSMENHSVYRNSQMVLPIALKNDSEISGFQLDLYLPAGVTVAKNNNGKALIATTDRMAGNYSITSNEIGGFTRVTGYSADGDAFTGNSGDFLNITLDIAKDMPTGDYTVQIQNIILSDNNNTEHHPADIESTLSVAPYTMADVDNNGAININDVVCIINHILNKKNVTFIEEAADVDGSGTININDVVMLINKYILMRDNAPAQEEASKAPMLTMADNNYLHLADIEIQPGETKTIEMLMSNANEVKAIQGNIKLPAGLSFVTKSNGKVDAKNIDDRAEDFTLSCGIQTDGSLTFAQYSGDGFTYEGNSGGIFTFKIKADDTATPGAYSVNLSNVVLSINGVGYDIPARSSNLTIAGATEIGALNADETTIDGKIFTIGGQQVNELQPGVNIVRTKNGSVKKVMMK